MCDFCHSHGDGAKWYLRAENYAADLSRDLERHEYVIDFVGGFSRRMHRNIAVLKTVQHAPRPLREAFRTRATSRQLRDHWGQPVPIEECERILDFATSVVQVPCVCRHFAGVPERGYCLGITLAPSDDVFAEAFRDYLDGPDTSALQRLTRDEALALLRRAEAEGMMHSVWTFKTPIILGICNCNLASGCMAMRTTLLYDHRTMWRGEYVAGVDPSACIACGACVEHCPFGAISVNAYGAAEAGIDKCYGCGVCRSVCPTEAIILTDREQTPTGASGPGQGPGSPAASLGASFP